MEINTRLKIIYLGVSNSQTWYGLVTHMGELVDKMSHNELISRGLDVRVLPYGVL